MTSAAPLPILASLKTKTPKLQPPTSTEIIIGIMEKKMETTYIGSPSSWWTSAKMHGSTEVRKADEEQVVLDLGPRLISDVVLEDFFSHPESLQNLSPPKTAIISILSKTKKGTPHAPNPY